MLGPDEFRRMIYQFKPRTQQDGTFGAFDCPDATGVVPRRNSSTTALQALNLLNDEFMHDQADRFAARIKATESAEKRSDVTGLSASPSSASRRQREARSGDTLGARTPACRTCAECCSTRTNLSPWSRECACCRPRAVAC